MANDKQQPGVETEQARLKKEEQARKSRRRSRQLIGFALSILIVVGAFSIIRAGADIVSQMMDNTAEIDTYNRRISPLVWFDPLPFESLAQADENRLKSACIWGVLEQRRESGEPLEQTALGDTLVPASLVDRYAASLFGPDFSFTPQETDEFYDVVQEMAYPYDAANQVYYIPPTSITTDYVSTVVEINRESGGVLRVIVGYVSTMGNDDRILNTPDYDHPARYMDYLFRRDGSSYYLYALETNNTYVPPATSSQPNGQADDSAAGDDSSLADSDVYSVPAAAPATGASAAQPSVAQSAALPAAGETDSSTASEDSSVSSSASSEP